MDYLDYIADDRLQKAAAAYTTKYGGRFVCEEPGTGLVYLDTDGDAFSPPAGATPDQMLKDLQSGKRLSAIWLSLEAEELDPDVLY